MSRPIVRSGSNYIIWSSVVDAPVSHPMTREQIVDYLHQQNEWDTVVRLGRADKYGSSYFEGISAEDVMSFNRAGPGETQVPVEWLMEWIAAGYDVVDPFICNHPNAVEWSDWIATITTCRDCWVQIDYQCHHEFVAEGRKRSTLKFSDDQYKCTECDEVVERPLSKVGS